MRHAIDGGFSSGADTAAAAAAASTDGGGGGKSVAQPPRPARIVAQAVSVLQKMVRDDRFHTKAGSDEDRAEAETERMSAQVRW